MRLWVLLSSLFLTLSPQTGQASDLSKSPLTCDDLLASVFSDKQILELYDPSVAERIKRLLPGLIKKMEPNAVATDLLRPQTVYRGIGELPEDIVFLAKSMSKTQSTFADANLAYVSPKTKLALDYALRPLQRGSVEVVTLIEYQLPKVLMKDMNGAPLDDFSAIVQAFLLSDVLDQRPFISRIGLITQEHGRAALHWFKYDEVMVKGKFKYPPGFQKKK